MLLFGRSPQTWGNQDAKDTGADSAAYRVGGTHARLLDGYARRYAASVRTRRRAGSARGRQPREACLSSAGSLGLSVRRRIALLAPESRTSEYQPALPLDEAEGEPRRGTNPRECAGAPGLADANRERRWLSAIAECAENASRAESRPGGFCAGTRMRQPVIVFTEFATRSERLYSSSWHDPDARSSTPARRDFTA